MLEQDKDNRMNLKELHDIEQLEKDLWEAGSEQKPGISLMNRRRHSMRSKSKGINPEHARLTENVSTVLVTFLHETHWESQQNDLPYPANPRFSNSSLSD